MNGIYQAAAASLALTTLWLQPTAEQRIDAAIDGVTSQVPGLALAVMNGGRVVSVKAVGTTSLSEVKPPDGDTQFRLASLSKPITAVGVFSLVERKLIDLDKPARGYCPALSELDGALTVRRERYVPGVMPVVGEALRATLGLTAK